MYDPSGLYIDPVLTNLSVSLPKDQNYYGIRLMPETPVRTQSGQYRIFDRSNWLLREDRREPGAVAHEIVGAKWSTDVFMTREHSLQVPIFDEERQQLTSQGGLADPVFGGALQLDPEQDATALAVRSIMLNHEFKVSTLLRNTANYPVNNTATLSGTSQWDNITYGTPGVVATIVSDPINDIKKAMRAVYAATLRWPNTLALPTLGLSYIENHPRVVQRFQNFSLTMPNAFQALTGFQGQIILLDSVYNTANNIDSTVAMTSYWGKDVWVGIVDPQPGLNTMSFGKTFAQIYPDGTTRPTERWREEPRKADLVRSNFKYDLKVVASSAGYLIKTAFSPTAF
jgi:hypothetical protein